MHLTPNTIFLKNANLKLFQKQLNFYWQHLNFFRATAQPEIWHALSHDRAGEGHGSIPGLTSQNVLHACHAKDGHGKTISSLKVHLTPNTIFAKMQAWSCSKSNLTFIGNIWIFFEQQYNLKFDMLCLMIELVRGMGLFPVWRHKLFSMHVHKELMPCKWVCDVKSGIEPGPCYLGREPIDNKFQLLSVNF